MEEKLLNSEETALFLGVQLSTLKSWRRTGVGPPFVRIGHNTIRYCPAKLQQWIEDRKE